MIKFLKHNLYSKPKRKLQLQAHKGNKYECPVCQFKSKDLRQIGIEVPVLMELKVVGAGLRKAGCWNCGAMDRDKLVYLYLRDELKIEEKQSWSVLHIAPEKSVRGKLLSLSFGEYICGDKFMPGYSYPEGVVSVDILELKFSDTRFDLVICNHVLEHIDDDILAMTEIYRVLKPGGYAILQVPFSPILDKTKEDPNVITEDERIKHFGQFDHLRIYGKDYPERLRSVGFNVRLKNISQNYPKAGVNPNESIFVIQKPS